MLIQLFYFVFKRHVADSIAKPIAEYLDLSRTFTLSIELTTAHDGTLLFMIPVHFF